MSADWSKALIFSLFFHLFLAGAVYYLSQPKEIKSPRVVRISLRSAPLAPVPSKTRGKTSKKSPTGAQKKVFPLKKTKAPKKTQPPKVSKKKTVRKKAKVSSPAKKKTPTASRKKPAKVKSARKAPRKAETRPSAPRPSSAPEESLLEKRLAALREKAEEKKLAEKLAALRGKMVKGGGLELGESPLPPGLAARLTAHLKSFWEVPELLKDRKDLVAEVELTVSPDGQILSWRFLKPSGNRLYDEAVAASLKRANPLPAPGRAIKLTAVFRIED